ncbi:MAG TPA: hypothetical protein VMI32_02870 [Candidatus Solibacter sp.]|nr:hypothetical protein [Candidatus Solibacter sp.]
MKKLTKEKKKEVRALIARPESEIDLTDIPEIVDWSGAVTGKFYGPNLNRRQTRAKVARVKQRKR